MPERSHYGHWHSRCVDDAEVRRQSITGPLELHSVEGTCTAVSVGKLEFGSARHWRCTDAISSDVGTSRNHCTEELRISCPSSVF